MFDEPVLEIDIMMKFSSKPISEHAEVPLADDGKLEDIVQHWQTRRSGASLENPSESACYVVSVGAERDPTVRSAQLAEIASLVESQGSRVVGKEIYRLTEPNPRTLVGSGTAEQMAERARAAGATMLVLDAELTPSQARNLEDVAGIPICDREAVILNVFLRHARTRRAKIQVEIARLEYLRPRIRGVGLDMDQQTGGTPHARGPGETASELLARKLDDRLLQLKKTLRKLETSGRTQREKRSDCKRIVLVGYTNAGKTSLMNALAATDLSARSRPFETLDTTSRCLTRHGGDVILSDTVGVIRRLPARLLASFESTLAEMVDASLLVIVVDAADEEKELHMETTRSLIEKMGAQDVPRFYVFNQVDRLPAPPLAAECNRWSNGDPWMALSSRDEQATRELATTLLSVVREGEEELTIFVPYAASNVLGLVYGQSRVLKSTASDRGVQLHIQAPRAATARIRHALREVRS
ncbi:MAG: GTPase HflX [Polyangiaceae bacterium]